MVSAGLLITDGEKFLVELPLHQTPGEHHFDLPKGHVEEFDSDFRGTAFREAKEETGYDFDSYKDRAIALCDEPVSYIKGKQIVLYRLDLTKDEMPAIGEYKCQSFSQTRGQERLFPRLSAMRTSRFRKSGSGSSRDIAALSTDSACFRIANAKSN